jgi:lysozyme
MQMSAAGLELLKRSEEFCGHAYLDAAGLPTIGCGHQPVHPECSPNGIAEPQGAALLANDLRGAEEAVARLVKVALSHGQFDALVDFCFNIGAGKPAASTLLKDLNACLYAAVAGQLLRWDHVGMQ